MSDILQLLRNVQDQNTDGTLKRAADEIERLRARVVELERYIAASDRLQTNSTTRIAELEADREQLEACREHLRWIVESVDGAGVDVSADECVIGSVMLTARTVRVFREAIDKAREGSE